MENISIFDPPITKAGQKPAYSWSLEVIRDYIREDAGAKKNTEKLRGLSGKEERSRAKTRLFKAATFSGTFKGRKDDDLIEPSGLLCLDIDHAEAQGWPLNSLKECVINDPLLNPRLVFVSPSGDGLKVVIEQAESMTGEDYYSVISRYFEDSFNLELDASCSNPARLCFLPHDPEVIYLDARPDPPGWGAELLAQYAPKKKGRPRKVEKPTDKPGLIGAFCKCYSVPEAIDAFLDDVYEPAGQPRHRPCGRVLPQRFRHSSNPQVWEGWRRRLHEGNAGLCER